MYRAAGNVPHCTSCVSWLPAPSNIAGRIRVEMRCAKNYPGTMVCSEYKREPGADDL